MITAFNDNHTKIGIEGWREIREDTLVVFTKPTNSAEDWISNFIVPPFPLSFTEKLGWCHLGYRGYAYWLTGMVYGVLQDHKEITRVVYIGYSMGGGVAQIAGLLSEVWIDKVTVRVLSIDGPRTTTLLPANGKLVRNKGSLVADIPPWFRKLPETVLSQQDRPFWEAHADYDIDKIIEGEL